MSVKRYVAGGIAVLAAIGLTVSWAFASADARAYRAAPACPAETVDISGCRWTVTAPVVGAAADRHGRSVSYHLTVDVPTIGRRDVPLPAHEALYDRAAGSTGYALRATGWHHQVVTLADNSDEVLAADAPLTEAHLTLTLAVVVFVLAAMLFAPGPPTARPTARRAIGAVLIGAIVAMVAAGAAPTASLVIAYGVGAVAAGVVVLAVMVTRLVRRDPAPA